MGNLSGKLPAHPRKASAVLGALRGEIPPIPQPGHRIGSSVIFAFYLEYISLWFWRLCRTGELATWSSEPEEVPDYESNPKFFTVSAACFLFLAGAFAAAQRAPAGKFAPCRGKLV